MNLKPLADYLIVKPLVEETTTKSGIVLPDTVDKEKPEKGEVIATGPGKTLESGNTATMSVKVGDKVMFRKYAPDEIKVDGNDYLVIRESDVMLIME
ncbi:MAG: co-chaperone GroES [Candidatus Falkowbacteria bacterium]|nr:co-chaperone GroES [Candidatus Falkowbacteria bacterium]